MPSFCTCGVELPPDARFCHKCGKPQYDMTPEADQPPEPVEALLAAAALPQQPQILEINFHNPIAVRTAMTTAIVGFAIGNLPIPPQGLWMVISLLLAGFLAAFFYVRRTGHGLTMLSGARIGWITGVFSFVISVVFLTLVMLLVSETGGFMTMMREHFKNSGARQADIDQMMQLMQSPPAFAAMMMLLLAVFFVLYTVLPTLGGLLGAKIFARDRA